MAFIPTQVADIKMFKSAHAFQQQKNGFDRHDYYNYYYKDGREFGILNLSAPWAQ